MQLAAIGGNYFILLLHNYCPVMVVWLNGNSIRLIRNAGPVFETRVSQDIEVDTSQNSTL